MNLGLCEQHHYAHLLLALMNSGSVLDARTADKQQAVRWDVRGITGRSEMLLTQIARPSGVVPKRTLYG